GPTPRTCATWPSRAGVGAATATSPSAPTGTSLRPGTPTTARVAPGVRARRVAVRAWPGHELRRGTDDPHRQDHPPRRTLAAQPPPSPRRPARRRRALPAGPHRAPGGRALGCPDRARDEPDGDLMSRVVTGAASLLVGGAFIAMVALTFWG